MAKPGKVHGPVKRRYYRNRWAVVIPDLDQSWFYLSWRDAIAAWKFASPGFLGQPWIRWLGRKPPKDFPFLTHRG